jgi:Tfp pilus assembly protein PilN
MKSANVHLNLLKDTERLSSSPVRLRVMLPVVALFACLGMALWWAILFTQLLMIKAEAQTIDEDVKAKSNAHAEAISRQDQVREMRQQLEQLLYYRNGVRAIGKPLAMLAEAMPLKVQLTELSFAPPPTDPLPKPGQKISPFTPLTNVETQRLVIAGRTTRETPVVALMESLESTNFVTLITREKRVKSFRQDANAERGKRRLLTFEVEYTMPERRFAK